MKQRRQSQFATAVRKAMLLSVTGFAGLSVLTSSVTAQDIAPGFTPGSTANQPFALLKEANDTGGWVPPVTEVEPPSVWSPPATQADAAPSFTIGSPDPQPTLNLPSSDVIEPPVDIKIGEPGFDSQLSGLPDQAAEGNSTFGTVGVPVVPETPENLIPDPNPILQNTVLEGFETQQSIESFGPVESFPTDQTITRSPFLDAPAPHLKTPVRNFLGGVNAGLTPNHNGVHAVGQLTFLSLSRDYRGRGRQLSSGGPNLFANGPDEGDFTGVDISYGRRRVGGKGWEMRYIGFNPDAATDFATSGPTLVWGGLAPPLNDPATFGGTTPLGIPQTFGLSGIGFGGFLSVADVFNNASSHRVSRDSEFGSFEFNLLRASAGGHRLSAGNATVELFAGLRGVSFQETTTFIASGTAVGFPRSASYTSDVENSLFGLQIGGRLERQLARQGWSTSFGTRVGIYNNRVESRQSAQFEFDDGSALTPQVLFGPDAGRDFDFEGKDNELAFLGELDFGVIYHFRPQTRARFGFRGIAIANIADSAGQLEDSLFDIDLVAEPKAIGDLIVGGFYFGVDHAF